MNGKCQPSPIYRRLTGWQEGIRHEDIILCAGAINSPQLLLLSGIGDAAQLRRHDITVVAEVTGVGRNLEDHLIVSIAYATPPGLSPAARLGRLGRLGVGIEWLLFKSGCFFKSSDEVDYADLQHEF